MAHLLFYYLKISRASKTTLLRSAPLFADTSAYGRGEVARFYNMCAPKISRNKGKTARVSLQLRKILFCQLKTKSARTLLLLPLLPQRNVRAGVDGEVGKIFGMVLHEPFRSDHRGIVGAVFLFGQDEPDARRPALFLQQFAQVPVGDDAAARGDGFALFFLRRRDRALRQNAARRRLEGRRYIRAAVLLPLLLPGVALVDDRRL